MSLSGITHCSPDTCTVIWPGPRIHLPPLLVGIYSPWPLRKDGACISTSSVDTFLFTSWCDSGCNVTSGCLNRNITNWHGSSRPRTDFSNWWPSGHHRLVKNSRRCAPARAVGGEYNILLSMLCLHHYYHKPTWLLCDFCGSNMPLSYLLTPAGPKCKT